ncbi:hypothetical protein C8A05DRAFT_18081, partial [Staphylotrichum tortipilum]
TPSPHLAPRCGSNIVTCDFASYRAPAAVCGRLMDILGDPATRITEIGGVTAQCYTASDGGKCCISWSRRVAGLRVEMLFGAAVEMMRQCARDGRVSGMAMDVDLAGVCTVQCLSGREGGCRE